MMVFTLKTNKLWVLLMSFTCSLLLSGCAQQYTSAEQTNDQSRFYGLPGNKGDAFFHEQAAQNVFAEGIDCLDFQNMGAALNYRIDKPLNLPLADIVNNSKIDPMLNQGLLLSPGDLLDVQLENGEGFNGNYVIDNGGLIKIPFIGTIEAAGDTTNSLETRIEMALIRAQIFQAASATVTIHVLNWSSIEIGVAGAVFEPGTVLINNKLPSSLSDKHVNASGDYSTTRLMSEAIRAASGIRPDAKLDQIILLRNGWQIQVDLTGMLTGGAVKDYPLVAGDRIIVPSTGCFQPNLVRPSQITPKGFRVFMSNLIDSSGDNSSAGIGRYATSLPYGTRLLQGAISANCVGGKAWTNAPRRVVLASKNPITGETQVIERSVEDLIRMPNQSETNPYLMPNDAIACYDSTVTNFRDIAGTLADILIPIKLL
jgi:protein involved in polysaccharide export with SLBB domain